LAINENCISLKLASRVCKELIPGQFLNRIALRHRLSFH